MGRKQSQARHPNQRALGGEWKMDIKTHITAHDRFAKLPRSQRERAYQAARALKPNGIVFIDELLAAVGRA